MLLAANVRLTFVGVHSVVCPEGKMEETPRKTKHGEEKKSRNKQQHRRSYTHSPISLPLSLSLSTVEQPDAGSRVERAPSEDAARRKASFDVVVLFQR